MKSYKTWLTTSIIAASTLMSATGAAYAKEAAFSDVPTGFWAADSIQWAVDHTVIDGYPDGSFKPDRHVEQAEFLAMLIRAYAPSNFTPDPNAVDWTVPYFQYAHKMNWAAMATPAAGGQGNGLILSRGKVAQSLANAAGKAYGLDESIAYLIGIGLIEGKTDKSLEGFKKDDEVTRAEAVALIQRFRNYYTQLLPLPSDTPQLNEFDPRHAKVGDVVAGWKIASLDTRLYENGELMSAIVEFENKDITVSGTYQNLPDDSEFFNGIVFTLDEASEKLIPKIKSGKQSTDNRILFRSPEAEAAFLPQGSTGRAKIVISGFSFHYWPKDDYRDNTKFVKAVEIDK